MSPPRGSSFTRLGYPASAVPQSNRHRIETQRVLAQDRARTPELYLLGATWWREALAEALTLLGEGEEAARAILRENALRLYPVTI